MADMKQVYDFAVKWCDKFRDQKVNYIELVDRYMADDCDALGFEMDFSRMTKFTNVRYKITVFALT